MNSRITLALLLIIAGLTSKVEASRRSLEFLELANPGRARSALASATAETVLASERQFLSRSAPIIRNREVPWRQPLMPYERYDLSETKLLTDVHKEVEPRSLLLEATSVSFLSFRNLLAPASIALIEHLTRKMRPGDSSRRAHMVAAAIENNSITYKTLGRERGPYRDVLNYLDCRHYTGVYNPIQKSLDNIVVVLVPKCDMISNWGPIVQLADRTVAPYNIMFMQIAGPEALWLSSTQDADELTAIYRGTFPNRLTVYKRGVRIFGHGFSSSTETEPGEDIFVWSMIKKLHEGPLKHHDTKTFNAISVPSGFPVLRKSKSDQPVWEYSDASIAGSIRSLFGGVNPGWQHYQGDGLSSLLEYYPRLLASSERYSLIQNLNGC
jgi:hypothetical protein